MPTKMVRYQIATGESIVVEEVVDDRGGNVARGDIVEDAKVGFEQALSTLRPATAAVLAEIDALAQTPDEVSIELGFSLKGEVGAIIAKTAAEGSFKLSLTWKPSRQLDSSAQISGPKPES